MKFNINYLPIFILFFIVTLTSYGQPPEPPVGKRWVLNTQLSDEFNGTELDRSKWSDQHMTWKGRVPAKFDPSTISVKNGNLNIENGMLDEPDGKYTIKGGAVQSLAASAHYGYYESRFKASKISMSTTFWLSDGKAPVNGKNNLENCSDALFSQELDIVEAIGGDFDKDWAAGFRNGMQFNTHVHYIDCSGKKKAYSKGGNIVEGDGQVTNSRLPEGQEVWQDYHTYGAWWKNPNEVSFFLDGKPAGTVKVSTEVTDVPFERPMRMQMLTETYNFATPYPSPAQLADTIINTSKYDWVRSYKLINIDENYSQPKFSLIENGDFETGLIGNWKGWGKNGTRKLVKTDSHSGKFALQVKGVGAAEHVFSCSPNTDYILKAATKVANGNIIFGVKPVKKGDNLTTKKLNNNAYATTSLKFNSGEHRSLKLTYFAKSPNDEAYIDDVELTQVFPTPKAQAVNDSEVFNEQIKIKNATVSGDKVKLLFTYAVNKDAIAVVSLYKGKKCVYKDIIYLKSGYGKMLFDKEIKKIGKNKKLQATLEIQNNESLKTKLVNVIKLSK